MHIPTSAAPPAPPYGLPALPTAPFPALAALCGRAALGETRETALACLLGARLALATLPPYRLAPEQRRQRALGALAWLAALALPADARAPLTTLFELAAEGPAPRHAALAGALRAVLAAAAPALDEPASAELARLADALGTPADA